MGGHQLIPGSEPELDTPFITVTSEGDTTLFGTEVTAENEDLAENRRHWQVPGNAAHGRQFPRHACQ